MVTIDGSRGEGGGQVLRTALSLAMVTGTPVRVEKIRAGRAKPGLMRQHLACVRAAQAVCGARVTGDSAGSTEISFEPGEIRAGEYRFAIGSAGSTTLLFQTVLPALLLADGPSRVSLEGGTHNDLAPSFDFLRLSFLPAVRLMGIEVAATLERYGFNPAGGGAWQAVISPWRERRPLELLTGAPPLHRGAVAISAQLPAHVGRREVVEVRAMTGWSDAECRNEAVASVGPGNLLSLRLHYATHATVIEQVGRHGVKAEQVAAQAVRALRRVETAGVAVEEHLADQLLLPMALGGGEMRTLKPSRHALTNMEVIAAVAGVRFDAIEEAHDCWVVRRR